MAGPGDIGPDPYAAARETTEGRVYTVTGGDWDTLVDDAQYDDRIVINMGPQHPSTHGVLRLVLELEGEVVTQARSVIGYLHTGIEKNCEYRTWTQGVTFVTRMDYLAPLFNEAGFCLATEKLLGIAAPRRAQVIRVLLMELNRISSHLVALATGGMELGALTGMTAGFREREEVLHLLEFLTGLRMNHAFIRPGGVAQDLPDGYQEKISDFIKVMDSRLPDYDKLLTGQPIWKKRLQNVGYLPLDGCLQLGVTGPILRSTGLEWDLRKVEPYCGYEEYDFEVPTTTEADCYARYVLRVEEIHQSLKLVKQAMDKLEPGPVMVEDKKIAWPAQLTIGADGMGNSLEHVRKIMGQSMESLIHHFKLVTEGFRVPAGQVYVPLESPRG
ncbi:MAG TPA: NADH-quinone oxidoreductase subunit D, partial [Pseudonocardiaceae bacterium]|nr:NADH-quinone oxidoreductase subunit D [Pseudonocardiaceae bacterium]